jgi:phosphatidylethanolamine/phosphatidyl-N-methylethanolamine N-methyltransferase
MDLARQEQRTSAEPSTARTYYRWARFYDLIFDWPFYPGRLAAARAVAKALPAKGRVLVAGVGTGLELGLLPRSGGVIGIDLARPMLDLARARVAHKGLDHVKALRLMDAGALEFEDASFDVVLAPYLLSVATEPDRVLDDMWRVTRPGGEMVILGHFSAETGLRSELEKRLTGAGAWLGWRPYFPYAVVSDWLKDHPDAAIVEERQIAPFRLFTLLRIRKGGARAA